jgi:4-amino-4-deoxy-L-arabinose transferase-like glycosyltransferase
MVLFAPDDLLPARALIDRLLDRATLSHGWAVSLLVVLTLLTCVPGFTSLFPMDRDEPRFAQASKQMLESGDFVDIRLQEEARNKKPVGIYWLQAGAVSLAQAVGVPAARSKIWVYRIPSLLGALFAVLLTYWAALALLRRRAAVMAGAMMAATLLLVVEAHLAKTDAVLLATVVAAMGALARVWAGRGTRPIGLGLCAIFWTAIAVGILVKGPITPMIPFFAAVALSIRERSARWLLGLRPLLGIGWCLLLVLPWFVLIVKATGTAFFAESIGHDMAGKVAGAQESHGAPVGTYLAAFWVTAWPFAPFVILAAPTIWRERWSDRTFFLLAWIVPAWLLFELVPTKLPHYVLPLYPALAMLAAGSLERLAGSAPVRGVRLWFFGVALALLPLMLPVALALADGRAASSIGWRTIAIAAIAFLVAGTGVALAIHAVMRREPADALVGALLASIAIHAFVLGYFLNATHADLMALSPRLAAAGRAAAGAACPSPGFASVGDSEPSLVFSTDTTLLLTDAGGAAAFMNGGPCRVAFVARPQEAAFTAALAPGGATHLSTRVAGININGGKHLDVGVYASPGAAP